MLRCLFLLRAWYWEVRTFNYWARGLCAHYPHEREYFEVLRYRACRKAEDAAGDFLRMVPRA